MTTSTKILLLNDGETFTGLSGCAVFEVPVTWSTEDIEAALRENDNDEQIDPDDLRLVYAFNGDESFGEVSE